MAIVAAVSLHVSFPINVIEDNSIGDAAEARRHYVDSNYSATQNCEIAVNTENSIYQGSLTGSQRRLFKGISAEDIKTFVLLHELGHCLDGEQAPHGINALSWREFLGDGFAAVEMEANQMMDEKKFDKFKLSRPDSLFENVKKVKVDIPVTEESVAHGVSNNEINLNQNGESIEFLALMARLKKLKEIRGEFYKNKEANS